MGTTPWVGQTNVVTDPRYPAVWVSWDDAQGLVAELNEATEGTGSYRLPTEAEWEYACRAGTTTRWSFGDSEAQLRDYAWYMATALAVGEPWAHEVGQKLPNPWGLHDMHGNVWEWCQDLYGSYESGALTDPGGPAVGDPPLRVRRGGRFTLEARDTRSAKRSGYPPESKRNYLGIRLLRTR